MKNVQRQGFTITYNTRFYLLCMYKSNTAEMRVAVIALFMAIVVFLRGPYLQIQSKSLVSDSSVENSLSSKLQKSYNIELDSYINSVRDPRQPEYITCNSLYESCLIIVGDIEEAKCKGEPCDGYTGGDPDCHCDEWKLQVKIARDTIRENGTSIAFTCMDGTLQSIDSVEKDQFKNKCDNFKSDIIKSGTNDDKIMRFDDFKYIIYKLNFKNKPTMF